MFKSNWVEMTEKRQRVFFIVFCLISLQQYKIASLELDETQYQS
jgi:hypothetical protein